MIEQERIADLSARGQELRRARTRDASLVVADPLSELAEQELAEQNVVVIRRRFAVPPIGEQMTAIEVVEQA